MWRSYYDKREVALFRQLGELLRSRPELQAEIYGLPVERVLEHGRLRAEAMTIRDERAKEGDVQETNWERIEELRRDSFLELSKQVNT